MVRSLVLRAARHRLDRTLRGIYPAPYVALDALDPSRLLAQAPPGRITLTARGGVAGPAAGLDPAALRGRVDLRLAPPACAAGRRGRWRYRPAPTGASWS